MKQRAPPSEKKDKVNIKMTLNLFLHLNCVILSYGRDRSTGFKREKNKKQKTLPTGRKDLNYVMILTLVKNGHSRNLLFSYENAYFLMRFRLSSTLND